MLICTFPFKCRNDTQGSSKKAKTAAFKAEKQKGKKTNILDDSDLEEEDKYNSDSSKDETAKDAESNSDSDSGRASDSEVS